MIFDAFTSDLHLGHKAVIKYCKRPFSSVDEMDEQLIKRYNDKISHNDKVLFVGDIFFYPNKKSREILSQMNGKKYLVIGNHDANAYNMLSRGFEMVAEKLFFKWEDKKIVISHYDNWDTRSPHDDRYKELRHPLNLNEMEVLIHGHTHYSSKQILHQIHVGCDAWSYGPARYEEIAPMIKNIPPDWNSSMRQKLAKLKRYREIIHLIRYGLYDDKSSISLEMQEEARKELQSPKYDEFREAFVSWENESEKRSY